MKTKLWMWVVVCCAIISPAASAGTYTGPVQYSAGTGVNSAYIAIDFDFEKAFVFEYRWDGQANAGQALSAIDAAGALDIVYEDFGWGLFIADFAYPGGDKYPYPEGSNVGWTYYVSGDGSDWQSSWVGANDRQLADGVWDSWVWTNYSSDWWVAYRTPGVSAIPEPASVILVGLGAAAVLRKRSN